MGAYCFLWSAFGKKTRVVKNKTFSEVGGRRNSVFREKSGEDVVTTTCPP